MAASITNNDDFRVYGIATESDVNALIPPDDITEDETGADALWVEFHEAAWQHHMLPWIERQGVEEADLSSTDNLKHATAIKALVLALEARGAMHSRDSRDYLRAQQLRADYREQLSLISLQTSASYGEEPTLGSLRMMRGS